MQPLLSICIPTYNRAEYLKKSIDSLICQKEFIEGKVEIVISDNASTDNTQLICGKYADLFSNFNYFRNEENIKDENFPLSLKRGNGILRKLSNDTLLYNSNALTFFCECVNNYKDTKPFLFFTNHNLKYSTQSFTSLEDFLLCVSFNITWIGSFSIWEDCISFNNETKYCELFLWQVNKTCELVFQKSKAIVINQLFATNQTVLRRNISYGLYKVFYENYFTILEQYIDKGILTIECKAFLKRDLLYNFFTLWIIKWEIGNKKLVYSQSENLKELVFNTYKQENYFFKYLLYYNLNKIMYYLLLCVKKIISFFSRKYRNM